MLLMFDAAILLELLFSFHSIFSSPRPSFLIAAVVAVAASPVAVAVVVVKRMCFCYCHSVVIQSIKASEKKFKTNEASDGQDARGSR